MTATQKIDGLVNSWYGYAVFGAALRLWQNSIGIISLITTVGAFLFWTLVTWFIGNRLRNKSSLMRIVLVVGSAIFGVLGTVSAAKMGWSFVHTLALSDLLYAGIFGLGVYMNAKSLKVLTDSSVKAYINS